MNMWTPDGKKQVMVDKEQIPALVAAGYSKSKPEVKAASVETEPEKIEPEKTEPEKVEHATPETVKPAAQNSRPKKVARKVKK